MNSPNYRHLHKEQSYQLALEPGQWARLDYQRENDVLHLNHTVVPPALRGKNAAAMLLEFALQDIDEQGLMINPVCTYVQSYLKRHPHWQRLVVPASQET